MSVLEWTNVRGDAVKVFRGELPGQQIEADVIEQFEQRPAVVVRAIEEIGERVAQGKVNSGWAVLRARLQNAEHVREVSVDVDDREARVEAAERWIRFAGFHFDREDEMLDDLFGERGRLRAWASDEALRERLAALWRELAPMGQAVEDEALERAQERRAIRERLDSPLPVSPVS